MAPEMNVLKKVEAFSQHLSPELETILEWIKPQPGDKSGLSPFLQMPKPDDVDMTAEEAAGWVVRTSNAYAKVSRLAGIARAELKLAEGEYKRAFKKALGTGGTNKETREAHAASVTDEQNDRYIVAQAMVELVESIEISLRIASESARKLYDKMFGMQMGEKRQHHAEHQARGAYS